MVRELAIIGAGNMAEAIARGVLGAGLWPADAMLAADPVAARRELFEEELRIHAVEDPAEAVRGARRILLSVKPQQMGSLLASLRGVVDEESLVISIAAGVSTGSIERGLGEDKRRRVVRAMPNTPMLMGQGMVGVSGGRYAAASDVADAMRIFESAASVVQAPEEQLDAVTALSGSGPAYFFFLVEQMIRAGVELGLPAELAHQLATRTASGAAAMMLKSDEPPEALRRKVTSPSGTTQAAIAHLEAAGVAPAIVEAIKAAHRRSQELSA